MVMKWLWLISYEEKERMWPFLNEADVVYADFKLLDDSLVARLTDSQVLVVFAEVLRDTDHEWELTAKRLEVIAKVRTLKVVISPSDPNFAELSKSVGARWFPIWTVPTWVFNFAPRSQKETFFVFYWNEVVDKGQDVVLPILGKLPIVCVGAKDNSRGFVYLNDILDLQSRSFSLLHPSRSDSISRTLMSAMILEQVPILLRTNACYFRNYTFGFTDNEFLTAVPIAESVPEFVEMAESAFKDPARFTERFVERIKRFMNKHRELFDPWICWQRWLDEFGFPLAADLMPLHNIFWMGKDNVDELPDGPWKQHPPSLNLLV